MKKLMHLLLLSCLRATELVEKKMDGNLSFIQAMQLKIHKSLCKACTMYEKQSVVLDDAIKNGSHKYNGYEIDLDKLKENIINKIDIN